MPQPTNEVSILSEEPLKNTKAYFVVLVKRIRTAKMTRRYTFISHVASYVFSLTGLLLVSENFSHPSDKRCDDSPLPPSKICMSTII